MRIIQAWGMTETSPRRRRRAPAGRRGGRGALGLPRDGRAGSLPLRRGAPRRRRRRGGRRGTASRPARSRCAARGSPRDYYEDPTGAEKFHDGWLRTGDIASIDASGYVRITDRAKDVIKSGGEWISSVELENELMAHPDVRRGGGDRQARRALGRAPAGLRGAARGRRRSADELREHLRGRGREVVAARRVRVHRRDPEDERRQVRQEGPAARSSRTASSRAA